MSDSDWKKSGGYMKQALRPIAASTITAGQAGVRHRARRSQ
jgi:hypothetical protein